MKASEVDARYIFEVNEEDVDSRGVGGTSSRGL